LAGATLHDRGFLADLLQAINLQTTPESDGADVAHVGNVLLRDGKSWRDSGYGRLSAALSALEEQKKVQVFRAPNGSLRVKPTPAEAQSASVQLLPVAPPTVLPRTAFRPLKSAVWFAFAVSKPEQRQLINRRLGNVWYAQAEPPGPALDWVEAAPVTEEEQKRWASRFVSQIDPPASRDALLEALTGSDWFRKFPLELGKIRPVLVRSWSQLRSAGIIEQVKAWAQKNNVSETVLFADTASAPARQALHAEKLFATDAQASPNLRDVLLGAIGQMPTEELLSLSIPARLLLKAARPDLLN